MRRDPTSGTALARGNTEWTVGPRAGAMVRHLGVLAGLLSGTMVACGLDVKGLADDSGLEASSDYPPLGHDPGRSPGDATVIDADSLPNQREGSSDSPMADLDVQIADTEAAARSDREGAHDAEVRDVGGRIGDEGDATAAGNDSGPTESGDEFGTICSPPTCSTACSPGATVIALTLPPGNTGSFGTAGPVCVRYQGNINGWGVANAQGRTVTVAGATTFGPIDAGPLTGSQPAVSAGGDGFIYWNFTAGVSSFAFLYIF